MVNYLCYVYSRCSKNRARLLCISTTLSKLKKKMAKMVNQNSFDEFTELVVNTDIDEPQDFNMSNYYDEKCWTYKINKSHFEHLSKDDPFGRFICSCKQSTYLIILQCKNDFIDFTKIDNALVEDLF